MNQSESEKMVVWIIGVAVLLLGIFFGYEYVSEPKMEDGVIQKTLMLKEIL